MKKIFFLLVLPILVNSQNTIGLPDVINYSKQTYNAGLQNWDIKQDKNGILYIANNEGLLSFDGKYWKTYPLPNKTIVRAVEIGADNKIYIGGQDEIGFFSPNENGQLQYHSLTLQLADKDKKFGDIWDIVSIQKSIFFRSTNKIFKLTDGNFKVFSANSEWSFMGKCNGKLYAHDFVNGILAFENNTFTSILNNNNLPINETVTSIISLTNEKTLITTLKHGSYVLTKNGITKFLMEANSIIENARIYAAYKINETTIALATSNAGVFLIDATGKIIQRFTKIEGLQNNNILSIFLDNQQNIWLGLDNGIDLISYNSAIKHINPTSNTSSGYTALIFNNKLFIGTSIGLFSVDVYNKEDISFTKGNFLPIQNTDGQIWNIAAINNQLLIGHHEGAMILNGNSATMLNNTNGFWNFTALSNTFPTAQMIAGNYKGISIFDYNNGIFKHSTTINGFTESSRFIVIDRDSNIWVSHPYHGIYKIIKNKTSGFSTITYSTLQGLPSNLNNHIYEIKNQLVVATEKGIYQYNPQKNKFEPATFYSKILGNQSIRYVKEDINGNIWFIHEKQIGVIDFTYKDPTIIYLPELNNKMLSGFECIYPVNDNNTLLGSELGFFNINYEKYKKNQPQLTVQIRNVRIANQVDSLLFGGYFNEVNDTQIQDDKNIFKVGTNWKTIRFEFASPIYGFHPNIEFSFNLKGFENSWSEWTTRTEKEYTNLPPGNYTFEVKVRSAEGKESKPSSFSFTILPKWYETTFAKFIYFIIMLIAIYFIGKWQQQKFKKQQQKHEAEQQQLQYIHDLEISKTEAELIVLRNEKLESEINFKNSELAASAMHLVKKGELLSKLKTELAQVMKATENQQTASEIKKVIKKVSEDDNVDKEWDHFAKHFDSVHSNFVVALKEKHPTISPNELKLAAYLRMNLTTKEIAQLMNISPRGVEISRYRLRKKLQLTPEISLFDYFINIPPKA